MIDLTHVDVSLVIWIASAYVGARLFVHFACTMFDQWLAGRRPDHLVEPPGDATQPDDALRTSDGAGETTTTLDAVQLFTHDLSPTVGQLEFREPEPEPASEGPAPAVGAGTVPGIAAKLRGRHRSKGATAHV